MITGTVRNGEAIVELDLSGSGQSKQVEGVIDTGFNGYLTLPPDLVSALQLPFAGHRRGMLADGSIIRLDLYMASVDWHGKRKDCLVSQASGTALIGMSLLDGSQLTIDVKDGGAVTIEEKS